MTSNSQFLWQQDYFRRFADIYAQRVLPLTIFTGSGSSLSAGYPNWDQLVDRLVTQLKSLRATTIGDAFLENELQKIKSLESNWDKIEYLSTALSTQYQYAVRAILKKEFTEKNTPSYDLWRLNPRTFLTVNLDGIAKVAYASHKTGIPLQNDSGFSVGSRSDTFSFNHKTFVELHGNIDDPASCVLTRSDLDRLLSTNRYLSYVRSIFSQSAVLFYGVGLDDASVGGHIQYLREIELNGGEFFIICKRNDEALRQIRSIPVQPIFIDEFGWDSGLRIFIDTIINYRPNEIQRGPVFSGSDGFASPLVSAESLVQLTPNEIRTELSKVDSNKFMSENQFDFAKYAAFCEEYDSPIYLSTRVAPGTSNNNWLSLKVDREIGKGNFGRVYLASAEDGSQRAIKVAHAEVRDNDLMLASFRRGVSSMRILSNDSIPGTVKIVSASELPPSIIMEYVNGINFEDYVYQFGDSPLFDRLKIIKRVCEIVQSCHLHESIVLHRDLRPANIMIGGEYWERYDSEQVYVLDFDLSWFKGATGSEYYMNSTQDLGYLAPEQLDQRSVYSTRSALVDVFGAGMLLYFSIQREHPFANASRAADWSERCLQAGRRGYNTSFRSCSWRLARLIHKATWPKQEQRPLLGSFLKELETIIDVLEGVYPDDTSVVYDEICFSMDPAMASDMSFDGRERKLFTPSGTEIFIQNTIESITFNVRHVIGETVDRRKRRQLLEVAFLRATELVEAIGKVDTKNSGVGQGSISLRFTIKIPRSINEMNKIKDRLSDIVSAASVV